MEIFLELPQRYLSPELCSNEPEPWVFPGYTKAQVLGVLDSAFLNDNQRDRLLQNLGCDAGGCRIVPPVDVSRSLTQEARHTLYSLLGQFPKNPSILYGFRRKASRLDSWFDAVGFRPSTKSTVLSLMWNDGDARVLSDVSPLCASLSSDEEKVRVVKALSRTRALLVRIRVIPNSDVSALVRYWTQGARKKDARPILEALSLVSGGGTLDIVHLLPAFGRTRLYTFAKPDDPPWDCNWTSLNFLGDEPQDRFLSEIEARRELQMAYYPIPMESAALGDVIAFVGQDSSLMHTAVFVADRLVYTKNGRSFRRPWVILSLDDLMHLYAFDDTGTLQVFRHR